MVVKQTKSKTFAGMTYRQLQRKNKSDRAQLSKKDRIWLKTNNYRNIGWTNVINLFQKIKELKERESIRKLDLEQLFIEADRIGNKYLTGKEIQNRNLKIARELNEIADIIDSQFPDRTVEVVDYSR